ncbi:MAG: hypothetical protein GY844_17435 [Bradyrhizobium sp.]|nr:hypothetical protein [Bradyrhizobium sp.]
MRLAFFIVTLAFLMFFCDHDGYEGDDLNSVVPMFHLDAAKQGALGIYRYAWQPLSYELGAAIYQATHWPDGLFLLAPVCGAISLSLLLLMLWDDRKLATLVASLVALLAIPELWYSGLYFNSTILGLPFALAALWLLRSRLSFAAAMLAGGLAGIAILMRLDFILACPAFAVTAWSTDRSLARPLVLALGVVSVLIAAALIGWLEPAQILFTYKESAGEIAARSAEPGWDLRTKLFVASVVLSPLGWGLVLLGAPDVILRAFRRDQVLFLAWTAAAAALAFPVRGLLSVKYVIPLLIFAPFFLMSAISAIELRMPEQLRASVLPAAVAASCFLLIFSFSLTGSAPYIHIGLQAARPVGTHDGYRSYGGYLWQMAAVDRYVLRLESQLAADCIIDEIKHGGPDIVVVGHESAMLPGAAGWRHAQLALERAGYRGILIAPHQIRFDVEGHRLTLLAQVSKDALVGLDRGRGVRVYDLRDSELAAQCSPKQVQAGPAM